MNEWLLRPLPEAEAYDLMEIIVHNKYSIEVKGRISMRKRHAFAESEELVNS